MTVVEDATVVDLVVANAGLLVTMDDGRREQRGGWVAIDDGFVTAIGAASEAPPAAARTIYAAGGS